MVRNSDLSSYHRIVIGYILTFESEQIINTVIEQEKQHQIEPKKVIKTKSTESSEKTTFLSYKKCKGLY